MTVMTVIMKNSILPQKSTWIVANEAMAISRLWIVPNSNPFAFKVNPFPTTIPLPLATFLRFNQFNWMSSASFIVLRSRWLVWFGYDQWIDLPQLQSVTLGNCTFVCCQSVVVESSFVERLWLQICLHYNPFNLANTLFEVILVNWKRERSIWTTRIQWSCEVFFFL